MSHDEKDATLNQSIYLYVSGFEQTLSFSHLFEQKGKFHMSPVHSLSHVQFPRLSSVS